MPLRIVRGHSATLNEYTTPTTVGDGTNFEAYFHFRPHPLTVGSPVLELGPVPVIGTGTTVDPYRVALALTAVESWQLDHEYSAHSVGLIYKHASDQTIDQVYEVDRLRVEAPTARREAIGTAPLPIPPSGGAIRIFNIDGPAYQVPIDWGDVSGAFEIDLALGNVHVFRLVGNITLTFVNAYDAQNILLEVTQGNVGGYGITWAEVNHKWAGKTEPLIHPLLGDITTVALFHRGPSYLGQASGPF